MSENTTGQTRITADLTDLENLVRELGGNWVARVGIIGEQAEIEHRGTHLTNAEIGVIQEFGSITNGIPARSFLRMPVELKQKDIVDSMANPRTQNAFETGNIKRVYRDLGLYAEAVVKVAFGSGGYGQWAPNKPSTIAQKGSDKPLIDTSQLRRSISSDVIKKSEML